MTDKKIAPQVGGQANHTADFNSKPSTKGQPPLRFHLNFLDIKRESAITGGVTLAFPRTFSDNPPTAKTKREGCRSPESIGGYTATWRLFCVQKKHGLSTLVPMAKAVWEALGLASFLLTGLRTRTRLAAYPFAGVAQGLDNSIGAKTMTAYTAHGAPTRTHTAHNLGKSPLFTFVVSIAKAGGVRYVCTLASGKSQALLNAMSHLTGNASDYRLGVAKMEGAA